MSDQRRQLFDPGLQPERTILAWRRTALALVIGSLGAARLLQPQLGLGAVILGLAGASAGVAVHVLAGRRLHRLTQQLLRQATAVDATGGLLATTAATCVLLGAGGLALVLLQS